MSEHCNCCQSRNAPINEFINDLGTAPADLIEEIDAGRIEALRSAQLHRFKAGEPVDPLDEVRHFETIKPGVHPTDAELDAMEDKAYGTPVQMWEPNGLATDDDWQRLSDLCDMGEAMNLLDRLGYDVVDRRAS